VCKDNGEVALVGVCCDVARCGWDDGITIAWVRWCGGGETEEIELRLRRIGPPLVDGGSGLIAGVGGAREREREREAFEVNPTGEGE
jgi:hypothetical protein